MQDYTIEKRVINNTQVFIGDDIKDEVAMLLKQECEEGALLCVYDANLKEYANDVLMELKRGGYRIFAKSVNSFRRENDGDNYDDVPEYVRYILAIGSGNTARIAKTQGNRFDIGWSIIFSAPTTDRIMCDKSPNQVFIDKKLVLKCPIECVASGYGYLLSSYFTCFEDMFREKVLAYNVERKEAVDYKGVDRVELCYQLLKLSSQKDGEDSADIMANIMYASTLSKGRRPRLLGEYKFLSSALLSSFYSIFLGALSIDCIPPANITCDKDILREIGIDCTQYVKKIDFFDINSYFKISYILSEYRMDLLDKLSSIDIHSMQRCFRRLYADAGYWLKREISAKSMLKCMALAGGVSDNLLGYAYASGVMNKF